MMVNWRSRTLKTSHSLGTYFLEINMSSFQKIIHVLIHRFFLLRAKMLTKNQCNKMVLFFPYLSSGLQAQYLSVFAVSKGSCKTKVEFLISIYSYVSSCEHVYNEASSKYIYYITIYILTLFSFQLEYH
jgi:hypothetical protein